MKPEAKRPTRPEKQLDYDFRQKYGRRLAELEAARKAKTERRPT